MNSKKNKLSIVKFIQKAEMYGQLRKRHILEKFRRKKYPLHELIPSVDVLSHIFLGFTQNGQYLLSYCFIRDKVYFYIWNFDFCNCLKLFSKHIIYRFGNSLDSFSNQLGYLYDSTAFHIYQWPSDDNYLLILTTPEIQKPSVINIVCIHINQKRSHLLNPGIMTFSVVDWGHKLSTLESKPNFHLKDYLNPGVLLFGKRVCTFHTGTEIVCLSIQNSEGKECEIVSYVLDVEQVLADTLDTYKYFQQTELSNYELLVCEIESNPLTIYAYIQAQIRDRFNSQSCFEFDLCWNAEKNNYEIEKCENIKGVNHLYFRLTGLIDNLKHRKIYSLNNGHFLETQTSYEIINSPVDIISITLSA